MGLLDKYRNMRDFRRTPEPKGKLSKVNRRRFVVQEHHASKLHFDFRLEMGGVLKSWSIPRGPSLDPADKRLAVKTENHPVEYLKFEGRIPEGEYGAGDHMIWDEGTYKLTEGSDALAQLEAGTLAFKLKGSKLRGAFSLVEMKGRGGQWLLIKSRDEFAERGWKLKLRQPVDGRDTLEKAKVKRRKAKVEATREGVKKFSAKEKAGGGKVVSAAGAFKSKELKGDLNVRVGRGVVHLTNLDRVYWPDEGYTKGDLVKYYYEVSKLTLPYLKDRPLIMKRYPAGIGGQSFHQHDVNEAPDFVRTVTLAVEDGGGHDVDYIVGDNAATQVYMANLGAIERHPWHSRVSNLDRPDWLVFDLDPGEGVAFETICDVAVAFRGALGGLGLRCFPKTSGSRGIHVYVPVEPVYDYDQIAKFAEQLATHVARGRPEDATVERSLRKRKHGQIYLDHMQNARGKSVAAPYSVRPKPGASVSAPLEWREVRDKKITPRDFTIKNVLRRVGRKGDLFRPVLAGGQRLEKASEALEEMVARAKSRRA